MGNAKGFELAFDPTPEAPIRSALASSRVLSYFLARPTVRRFIP